MPLEVTLAASSPQAIHKHAKLCNKPKPCDNAAFACLHQKEYNCHSSALLENVNDDDEEIFAQLLLFQRTLTIEAEQEFLGLSAA